MAVSSFSRSLFLLTLALFLCSTYLSQGASAQGFTVFASNNPPFNYTAEDGTVQGIAVDVLKLIMERTYYPIDQADISIINWARALDKTMYEPNHILLSPARTPKRDIMFSWVGPLHSFKLGLIARKNHHVSINDPADLRRYKVGVIRDSAPIHILENQFHVPQDTMTELAGDEQLFRMLDRGRVDLIPRGQMSASYWIKRLQLPMSRFEFVFMLKELDLYLAFSPMTDPLLIQELNRELKKLKHIRPDGSSEYQEIVSRHLGEELLSVQ